MLIAGWYEGEYGANQIAIANAATVEDLADLLWHRYGDDIVGVDLELEGAYTDGTDVNTTMTALWDELDFLSSKFESKAQVD
jgi:hypothetical protein